MQIRIFKSKIERLSDSEARLLTSKFLDGATDVSDERRLYDYYNSGKVAAELNQYRDMFRMYAAMDSHRPKAVRVGFDYRYIAAVVAVVLITGIVVTIGHRVNNDPMAELYAGSYIIRNGKKITDIKRIMPEIRWESEYVDSVLNTCDILQVDDIEREIIENAVLQIDDPETRELFLANI